MTSFSTRSRTPTAKPPGKDQFWNPGGVRLTLTPEEFIARAPWRAAMTMPHIPHEYTVRGETRDAEFEWFVRYIRENGYRARYGGRYYTYLEVDEHKYWTMGAAVGATTIINRAQLRADEAGPYISL